MSSNDPIKQALVQARVKMLFNQPFFGQIACHLELIDASKWCKTAATDGRKFYYNREFIKKLSPEELVFLFGHEVLHAIYDHIGRRGSRDPQIWNMANDYIVNYTLIKSQTGKMLNGGLYSEEYTDEMSSEEIYNLLMKKSVQVVMPIDEHLNDMGGKGKQKGSGGSGDDGDDGDGEGQGDGDGDQEGNGGGGSGNRKATVTVMSDGTDGPPTLTEEDLQDLRTQLKATVLAAAQSAGAGSVPAGVRRLIEELTEPKMDWRTLLEVTIQSALKDDFTFRRFSRKSWNCGAILPGQDNMPTIDIVVSLDMSGSISDAMAHDFLSEVKGIMDQYPDFKIHVVCFDTRCYNDKIFTPANYDELLTYEAKGGGGTDFMAVWEWMRANDIEPDRMVMFTDGYPNGSWGEENYCDTLFIIHGNKSIVPPFGLHAYYDED